MNQSKSLPRGFYLFVIVTFGFAGSPSITIAAEPELGLHAKDGIEDPPDFTVLPNTQWQAIEQCVDRGIEFLVSQQYADGSFGDVEISKPAITSLAAMAMISRGHLPDESAGATKQSKSIVRAIDYVLSRQGRDGMLGEITRGTRVGQYSKFMMYNHAICGMFLTEVYGMTGPERSKRIEAAVDAALKFVRHKQTRPMPTDRESIDRGGWRYLGPPPHDPAYSDLSVSSWYVMFMRSAENAGFDVPIQWAADAINYVLRCYDKPTGAFRYLPGEAGHINRGMTGAGVVSLFLTGHKEPEMEQRCGRWIVSHPFDRYNVPMNSGEHFHYGAYYASQASLQIGGQTWEKLYPVLANTFITHQNANGSWQVDVKRPDIGNVYTTALSVLALTPPYQLLPIYQR